MNMRAIRSVQSEENIFLKIYTVICDKNFIVYGCNKKFFSLLEKKFINMKQSLKIIFSNKSIEELSDVFLKEDLKFCELDVELNSGKIFRSYIFPLFANFSTPLFLIHLIDGKYAKRIADLSQYNNDLTSNAFMLMGLAHEIKNPLAGIKVLAESIESECEQKEDIKNALHRIARYVDRVNSMLEVFFSYVRTENEKKEIISIDSLVEDIVLFCENRFRKMDIKFEVLVEKTLFIIANRNQLLNLVLNLVKNAEESVILSGKREKRISLRVFIRKEPPENFNPACLESISESIKVCEVYGVCIECKDNGVGMDEFEKKHIFDPFFTTKDRGVGLGMSMVLKYVSENCGDIFFESEKGEGAVFRIILPGLEKDF